MNNIFAKTLVPVTSEWEEFEKKYTTGTQEQYLQQAINSLYIKTKVTVPEEIIPILDKIYKAPASDHVSVLLKQLMI